MAQQRRVLLNPSAFCLESRCICSTFPKTGYRRVLSRRSGCFFQEATISKSTVCLASGQVLRHMHYGQDDFASSQKLEQTLGRARPKEMGLDFERSEAVARSREQVQQVEREAVRDSSRAVGPHATGPERFAVEVPRPEHGLAWPTTDLAADKTWADWQACQNRIADYELDQRELQEVQKRPHKEPMTFEQARMELRVVEHAARDLKRAETYLAENQTAMRAQEAREAAYAQVHPWRSYLGLHSDHAAWQQRRQSLETQAETVHARWKDAARQVQALQAGPNIQARAQEVLVGEQARRDREQARLAELQERQQRDAARYAQDQQYHAQLSQRLQERDTRMASHRTLSQQLEVARGEMAQVQQTPERLWAMLPEVQRAEQQSLAARQSREATQDRLVAMGRACASYAEAHPVRHAVGYGAPYTGAQLRQAHEEVSQAKAAEQEAQARVEVLRDDPQLQQQHAERCDEQRVACAEAQERVDELASALREQEEPHAHDLASSQVQQEHARGHERGIELER
jgi:hypothetical protein